MQRITVVAVLLVAVLAGTRAAGAQELRGFAAVGVASDLNSRYPAGGGGVLLDLGQPWVSAGAQGEAFFSWPYVAGRGAVFGQLNVIPRRSIRPFLLAGRGFGESAGTMFGGGLEVHPRGGRIGLRFSVEDYLARVQGFDCAHLGYTQVYCDANLHGGRSYTAHQISARIGVVFQ